MTKLQEALEALEKGTGRASLDAWADEHKLAKKCQKELELWMNYWLELGKENGRKEGRRVLLAEIKQVLELNN